MTPPDWLAELHRRWQAARGKRTTVSSRPYGMYWEELLDAAQLLLVEDRQTAQREAEALEKQGKVVLKRHRSKRYLVERISLAAGAEPWLRELFGTHEPAALKQESLEILAAALARGHPLVPDDWNQLCESLAAEFVAGRSPRPFAWHNPDQLRFLLETLHALTSHEWSGIPVRTASVQLGLDTKALERHCRVLESALGRLFGKQASLADLGLVMSESVAEIHGPLELVFKAGDPHLTHTLGAPYALAFADLLRAAEIRTTALRLLTVENSKTTFRQLAAANPAGETLIVASSFPTPALRELLAKLPAKLPHHHFGDTDPSGWLILQKLREASPRPVQPFRMKWRAAENAQPLSVRDREQVDKLLSAPEMTDCHAELEAMIAAGNRGDFEQESQGAPDLAGWPFFSRPL